MLVDDNGELLMDFVGRYENLQDDFNSLRAKLGITQTLPHLNKSNHRDYRSYYNDHTQQLVAEHFKADIELFGYSFSA
jgi:hypothetical protein